MLGRGVGLVELVERARDRTLARYEIARWSADVFEEEIPNPASAARAFADEVCLLALCGQFRMACAAARPRSPYIPMAYWAYVEYLADCPPWVRFNQTVALAEHIDSYLAALESDRRLAALAQDCRGELDLLRILADLCEDAQLPRAAAEARHLHELADEIMTALR